MLISFLCVNDLYEDHINLRIYWTIFTICFYQMIDICS